MQMPPVNPHTSLQSAQVGDTSLSNTPNPAFFKYLTHYAPQSKFFWVYLEPYNNPTVHHNDHYILLHCQENNLLTLNQPLK